MTILDEQVHYWLGHILLCSILPVEHSCSDEVLDKLSTLDYKFSLSRKISL